MSTPHATRAQAFRQLHASGLLLLANTWDAGTARVVESLGAPALATSSAGVAWARGYPDGDALPVKVLLDVLASITRVVEAPLTADIEGGYSDDPEAVGEVVEGVLRAGAVGINLEDGTSPVELLAAKIQAARRASQRVGLDVFVNARTDVYLQKLVPEERRLEETLARAERYRAAGADGLFVPGLTAANDIRTLAASVGLPLNLMADPALPALEELQALGVRRLSAGATLAKAIFGRVAALATGFLRDGSAAPLVPGAMPYPTLNTLMKAR
ncbi:isocitrate lyase/phosphoenolpyruvate mutase family protein [Myxococcus sp. K15C18031901]|uniref:isocitrate lyase/PEP mutase family protein n=1 Tax=Myxococcus dinghuensis TaxID=2906761 RepID=UPI0020A6E6CC|nr:isocitrate lyase/phosphoenolpyruvate mutase family protein [Myxococcus dinghuensis]MCP3103787.1 isocitrate lyase/phosphoenolpyruvate mutase family protein [Myxococcus dinghuensis]